MCTPPPLVSSPTPTVYKYQVRGGTTPDLPPDPLTDPNPQLASNGKKYTMDRTFSD